MSAMSMFGDDDAPGNPVKQLTETADPPATAPASQSLYRKYRPSTFDDSDLVGQEHIVRTLRNAIRLNRVAHAYLFCGPRGTGKTTSARLLAKAVNCLDPEPDARPCNRCTSCVAINSGSATDVIEIDAASNRGIDDIRDLRERVKYAPTQLTYKFYIVDEAHQITGAAANAFLKTLEEPPGHTKFVLATTDPEELLPTIVSRCQRFDFRRINQEAMLSRLRTVATAEQIVITDDALTEIARHATGSLRDGLGLLDQLSLLDTQGSIQDGEPRAVNAQDVRELLGISRNDRIDSLVGALAARDAAIALGVVNDAVDAGEDPRQLNRQIVAALRTTLHDLAAGRTPTIGHTEGMTLHRIAQLLKQLGEVDYKMRHSPYAHLPFEIALVEATLPDMQPPVAIHAPSEQMAANPPRTVQSREAVDGGQPTNRLQNRLRRAPEVGDAASTSPTIAFREPESAPERQKASASGPATREKSDSGIEETGALRRSLPSENGSNPDNLNVEWLADLWPRIRFDLKSINRRAEALLASTDPIRVSGRRVTLATPYEFHRDKLNSDDVRQLLETIISRHAGAQVTVSTEIAGSGPSSSSMPTAPAEPAANGPDSRSDSGLRLLPRREASANSSAPSPSNDPPEPPEEMDADDVHEHLLNAARNIFDGEIIED